MYCSKLFIIQIFNWVIQVGISPDAWTELDTNWQKIAAQVRY